MDTIGTITGNPAAFGWDWTEPDSGTRFQLCYPRGTNTLTLGLYRNGRWDTLPVSAPERFLRGERPTTVKARWDPARVLAECAAKRNVVGLLTADVQDRHNALRQSWATECLHGFASVYADHPQFQEEWGV